MNTTAYLAKGIADDPEVIRQVRSLIHEKGYEEQAPTRLHEWVENHMMVIVSPPVMRNPYSTSWPVWMKEILTDALLQVDWNELVNKLKETKNHAQ